MRSGVMRVNAPGGGASAGGNELSRVLPMFSPGDKAQPLSAVATANQKPKRSSPVREQESGATGRKDTGDMALRGG